MYSLLDSLKTACGLPIQKLKTISVIAASEDRDEQDVEQAHGSFGSQGDQSLWKCAAVCVLSSIKT